MGKKQIVRYAHHFIKMMCVFDAIHICDWRKVHKQYGEESIRSLIQRMKARGWITYDEEYPPSDIRITDLGWSVIRALDTLRQKLWVPKEV